MSQKGLTPIAILLIITIILVGGISLYRSQANQSPKETVKEATLLSNSPSPSPEISPKVKANTNPVMTKPSATPSPKPSITPTPSPNPTSTPQAVNLSCEISLRGGSSSGWPPFTSYFAAADHSPNGGPSSAQWDFDGDGNWDTDMSVNNLNTSYTYQKVGNYEVKVRTHNNAYGDTSCSTTITMKPPSVTCEIHMDKTSGKAPLTVNAFYGASFNGVHGDDYVTNVEWDFNGDGNWDTPFDVSSQHPPAYTYNQAGNYTVKMKLQTKSGLNSDVCSQSISVE